DVDLAVDERLQGNRGAQRGARHRDPQPAVQLVALALEDLVGFLVDLDVEVTGGTTAGADLALSGQPDAHAVAAARRDLGRDRAPRTHPAVPTALAARVGDDLAKALARRARPGRHDLAEERALHRLDLALAAARVARGDRAALRHSGAAAQVAQHRGVDGDVLVDARRAFLAPQPQPDERVGTGLHPAARATTPATARGGAEEGVHDVAEPAEAAERIAAAAATRRTGTAVHGVTAQVDDLALLGVGQHLVGRGHL